MIKIPAPDLYKHDLLDHAKNPRNYGLISDADFCSKRLNPSCGDSVALCGFIEHGAIKKISFEGAGCVLSLAMASKLTERAIGMSVEQVAQLNDETVELLLGIELGINRLQCGLLPIKALQQGVQDVVTKASKAA